MPSGTSHWLMQRVTAVALLPLSFWFIFMALPPLGKDYPTAHTFLGTLSGALPAFLWTGCLFYHGALGIQVILEDYVSCEKKRSASLMLLKGVSWAGVFVGSLALFKIFSG